MSPIPVAATAVPATAEAYGLAEGPWWDGERERLLWVDIVAGRVLEGRLADLDIKVVRDWRLAGMTGAVAVTSDGDLLIAGQEGLVLLGDAEDHVTTGPRLLASGCGRRLNDGCPDPAGRYLVGTLTIGGPDESAEELFVVEPDGTVATVDDDLSLSNGLAWSADGTRMFSTDTMRGVVWERDYDPASGARDERRPFIEVTDGYPDGCTVDSEDHLWVAHWGIGEVRRYAPDGTLVDRVRVDAPNTSAVTFAGPDLRTLVITTASVELEPEQLAAHPDSGRLFVARYDVPGVPAIPARVSWARA